MGGSHGNRHPTARIHFTLGGAAAAWPLAARAQQARAGAAHRRAHGHGRGRSGSSRPASRRSRRGCSNWAGPIGRNVRIDYRWGGGDADDMRKYAAELVALAPDVILAHCSAAVAPLLQATRTVPIVFVIVADPVGAGFVESLARPGGNVTGFMKFEYGMSGKWLELLKEIAPRRDAGGGPSRSRHSRRDRPVRRNPGCGAVARGGGEPGRRARCRRDRARRHGVRAVRMAA